VRVREAHEETVRRAKREKRLSWISSRPAGSGITGTSYRGDRSANLARGEGRSIVLRVEQAKGE